jgi:hypothetical protein
MDDVFQFRSQLVGRYSQFSRSFVEIAATNIKMAAIGRNRWFRSTPTTSARGRFNPL